MAGAGPQDTRARDLKSLSLAQLGDVEVTTQFKEPTEVWNTPAAIYVLTNEDIRRSGVTSVPDALRLIPGVNVARVNGSRNWAIGIRGFGDQFSKYVLVLIDGRSVYTPCSGVSCGPSITCSFRTSSTSR
jgi:iron complex outermembrane receptor protein